MTDMMIIDIGRKALLLMLYLSAPMLILALVLGLLISLFQAATHLNEATLTFVPKLVAIGAVLILVLPWMIQLFRDFFVELMMLIPQIKP
jgi:flagellar biosynthetic protein FliQ